MEDKYTLAYLNRDIVIAHIKELCLFFKFPYDDEDPEFTIGQLCKEKLNKTSQKEWEAIPYSKRKQLVQIGELLESGDFNIVKKYYRKIKVNTGINQFFRQLLQANPKLSNEALINLAIDRGYKPKTHSMRVQISQLKAKMGLPTSLPNKGIKEEVTELFNKGKGLIHAPEIVCELEKRGKICRPPDRYRMEHEKVFDNRYFSVSQVNMVLTKLKKECNFKAPYPRRNYFNKEKV